MEMPYKNHERYILQEIYQPDLLLSKRNKSCLFMKKTSAEQKKQLLVVCWQARPLRGAATATANEYDLAQSLSSPYKWVLHELARGSSRKRRPGVPVVCLGQAWHSSPGGGGWRHIEGATRVRFPRRPPWFWRTPRRSLPHLPATGLPPLLRSKLGEGSSQTPVLVRSHLWSAHVVGVLRPLQRAAYRRGARR